MCGPFLDFYAFQMGLNPHHIFILAFKKFAHHYENYFITTNGGLFLKGKIDPDDVNKMALKQA